MNKKTQQITTGAAMIAIFCVMLLINRQTGDMFQEIFLFLFPLPMVAYSVQYDWKSGIPVLIAMSLTSLLFGNLLSIFYAITEAVIGFIFGTCIYRKVDGTKTLFIVMGLSAVTNVLNTIVLADLFGMSLDRDIKEMQDIINAAMSNAGVIVPEQMIDASFLKQMMIMAMIFLGLLQGFAIYQLTLLVLRRLRFQIPKPKSIYLLFPPKWLGYAAVIFFYGYGFSMAKPLENPILQTTLQSLGMFGNYFLAFFGYLGILFYVKVKMPQIKILGIIFGIMCYIMMPVIEMMIGFLYVSTSFHQSLVNQWLQKNSQMGQ